MTPTTHQLIISVLEDAETVHNISQGIRHAIKYANHIESINLYVPDMIDLLYALARHEQNLLNIQGTPDKFLEILE